MNPAQDLDGLLVVCEALYGKHQQGFARLLAKEGQLRHELRRLEMIGESNGEHDLQPANMRAIGADIIWQGWLARTKSALNIELANTLAVKEQHINQVRESFGKLQAVKQMQSELVKTKKKAMAQSALAQAVEMSIYR